MSKPATYTRTGPIARIVLDDGNVNVMSSAMLAALHEAFDQAEKDDAIVILIGRGKTFSAGFDLKVFSDGDANANYTMLKSGAELAYRLLSFPTPIVAAFGVCISAGTSQIVSPWTSAWHERRQPSSSRSARWR
jgi:enoyl-CoA hydratase